MTNADSELDHGQEGERQAVEGERRVQDRRAPWRVWVPTYVIRTYGKRLGPNGLSIYLALAWYLTREAPTRWPSLADIADLCGCSRSTVERTMRVLRTLELVATETCIEPKGQRSNYIYLIDPPDEREQTRSSGPEFAGAVTEPGGRRQVDGAPPAISRGGAVCETAPSLGSNSLGNVCVNGTHTHTTSPAKTQDAIPVEQIVAQWVAHLLPGAAAWNAEQLAAIQGTAPVLLARGYTVDYLVSTITRPGRPVNEWPREWAQRVLAVPPKVARRPPTPVQTPPDGLGANASCPSNGELVKLGNGSYTEGVRLWFAAQAKNGPGADRHQVNGGEGTPSSSASSGADSSPPGATNG